MKRSFSRGRVVALPLVAGMLLLGTAMAGALTPPDPTVIQTGNIDICHRTNSNSNPYVQNAPDVEGVLSGHADHTGPVWDPTLKADHIKWGDIIPPFKYGPNPEDFFPGSDNWDEGGEAIYENDCDPEPPPPELFGTLTIAKVVVNPESPDVPQGGFTVHVECDDKARDDIVIPKTGTGGTPVVIDGIEAGSTCIVTEVNPPAGVSYTPLGVNTTGVVVDDEQTVAVTITNPFTIPGGQTVTPAVEAVTVTPRFTG